MDERPGVDPKQRQAVFLEILNVLDAMRYGATRAEFLSTDPFDSFVKWIEEQAGEE